MKKLVIFSIASIVSFHLYSQVGIKKKDTVDLRNNIALEAVTLTNFPLYTIHESNLIHGGKGRLTAYLPKDTTITVTISDNKINIPVPIYSLLTFRTTGGHYDTLKVPVDLEPFDYHIWLNLVEGVIPIKKQKVTRLKAGFLLITTLKKELVGAIDEWEWTEGVLFEPTEETWIWTLHKQGVSGWELTGKKGKIFALPPGEYSLSKKPPHNNATPKYYKVIIKDGEWVVNGVKTN